MDIQKIKDEIVESVKLMFKKDFESKVDEALKTGAEIKTKFMLEEADIEAVNALIAEAITPLSEEIAKLKGEGEVAETEGEEMKKEISELKASKEELEVKLAAQPEVEKTKVIPTEAKEVKIELNSKADSKTRLEAKFAKKLLS
jgi:hypothetical protein